MQDNQQEEQEQIENECEEKHDEMELLRAQFKELEDRYLRTHADFENVKKRLEREKTQSLEYAYEAFAKDLLPVMDTLESAIASVDGSSIEESMKDKFKEGLLLTLENFHKVFERYGITEISEGGEFDPNLHNAVKQSNSPEHEDGQIVQVLRKGYRYKERVLRAAYVNVCKK